MTSLTVVYDEKCHLCRRARGWLLTQPCHVPVKLLAAGSGEARRRFGALPWLGQELVVADDDGRAWVGPAAFLTCLWATQRYRSWSYRLSGPTFAPMAERFFYLVSKNRKRFTGPTENDVDCSWCEREDPPPSRLFLPPASEASVGGSTPEGGGGHRHSPLRGEKQDPHGH